MKQQASTESSTDVVARLESRARQARRDIVWMIHEAKDGHPGASLSVTDILVALYHQIMAIDPSNPEWADRDRCILSKGHACPALYAVLARHGYFSPAELPGLRSICSILQGHPDMNKTPGVDSTSGSLGNGIAIGLGMSLAARIQGKEFFTYVVTGDGELGEGVVWEGVTAAAKLGAGRLIAFVDNNGLQSGGTVEQVGGISKIYDRFHSFGWHCQEVDGHDFAQLLAAVASAKEVETSPSMILCHTEKGHGVPFMVGDNSWHKRVPTSEELAMALEAIGDVE